MVVASTSVLFPVPLLPCSCFILSPGISVSLTVESRLLDTKTFVLTLDPRHSCRRLLRAPDTDCADFSFTTGTDDEAVAKLGWMGGWMDIRSVLSKIRGYKRY